MLYLQLADNTLSQNELIALWEKKTSKTFERVCVPKEDIIKMIQGKYY